MSIYGKRCVSCNTGRLYKEFPVNRQKTHPHNVCIYCLWDAVKDDKWTLEKQRVYILKRRLENPERAYEENLRARYKRYGLTPDDVEIMLETQDYICIICTVGLEHRNLHVDHSHDTGKVRGLLCGSCNTGLAHFRDNTEIMARAIEYLSDE